MARLLVGFRIGHCRFLLRDPQSASLVNFMSDSLNETKPSAKELLALLTASPIVTVKGVVSPLGVSGGKSQGEDRKLFFWLQPWRIENSELQTTRLTVQRVVPGEEFYRYFGLIVPYTVIRFQARVVLDAHANAPQGLLEKFLGVESSDPELLASAETLQEPVTFDDLVFGTFRLDARVDWYSTNTQWNGRVIRLTLSATNDVELQAALQNAHALWKDQVVWNRRVRRFAVQKLLSLKNGNWRRSYELPITSCQFRAKMKLESIKVGPDGYFEFWHHDGGMFWGHSIQIRGNLKYGPISANLAG